MRELIYWTETCLVIDLTVTINCYYRTNPHKFAFLWFNLMLRTGKSEYNLQIMMSSKILKLFIKVVFNVYKLFVNLLQLNNLGSIKWINISNLSIKGFMGPGGYSANLEAWRSFLQGRAHRASIHPLPRTIECSSNINKQIVNIAVENLTDYSFLSRYTIQNQRII